ncbi:MAG: calcium/sodium antiporter [Flavobacteriales bacterium]|nr:calcium/sodium antiporter [Flavobacteriales bacterium]
MSEIFQLLFGLVILLIGGEFLVRGSITFAKFLKVSPLVIGLTVVSFGTSAPELLVSLQAALNGSPDLAVGNIIGSNIANLALVLGLTVLILPMVVDKSSLFFNWLVMIMATLLFCVFSITNQKIVFWEGLILFSSLLVYLLYFFFNSNKIVSHSDIDTNKNNKIWLALIYFVSGSAGLYYGAKVLVSSAEIIAIDVLGISEAVVGSTIVAFGTSLPELVASCVAAFKKQSGISIGNLIGSNIFNLLAVIGVTSIITPVSVYESFIQFDFYWLIIISIIIGPVLLFFKKVGRVIGSFLVLFYIAYILFLL